MSGYEDAFGDAVYEAWRSGLDPDAVDRESVDEFWHQYGNRQDAAEAEVERLRRDSRGREADE